MYFKIVFIIEFSAANTSIYWFDAQETFLIIIIAEHRYAA